MKRIILSLHENIDRLIKLRGMNRKEFAMKLIDLKPTLNRMGEVPSLSAIYTYINGTASIKAELIPYIADVLEVTEQQLFNNSKKTRIKYLKYILEQPTEDEILFIKNKLLINEINIQNSILAKINHGDINIGDQSLKYELKEVIQLLKYAPIPFLAKLTKKLKRIKKDVDDF